MIDEVGSTVLGNLSWMTKTSGRSCEGTSSSDLSEGERNNISHPVQLGYRVVDEQAQVTPACGTSSGAPAGPGFSTYGTKERRLAT